MSSAIGSSAISGEATRSASTSCTSSITGESIIGLAVSTAKASPSVLLAIRMVRSLPARSTALAHCGERRLDAAVRLGVVGQKLEPRAGADAVVGDGQHDALGVAVVGHLVAAALAELACGRRARRRCRPTGRRPSPSAGRSRRWSGPRRSGPEARPEGRREGPLGLPGLAERPHQTVPPGDDLGELDAQALGPAGLLGLQVLVGGDLVGQRVLLDAAGIAAGLPGPAAFSWIELSRVSVTGSAPGFGCVPVVLIAAEPQNLATNSGKSEIVPYMVL